jgi:hypothetical protein
LKSSNRSRAEPAVDKIAATTSKVVGSNKRSISLLEGSSSTTRNKETTKPIKKTTITRERERERERERAFNVTTRWKLECYKKL